MGLIQTCSYLALAAMSGEAAVAKDGRLLPGAEGVSPQLPNKPQISRPMPYGQGLFQSPGNQGNHSSSSGSSGNSSSPTNPDYPNPRGNPKPKNPIVPNKPNRRKQRKQTEIIDMDQEWENFLRTQDP